MERLADDDRLPLDKAQLDKALEDKAAFIGAAESQVDRVLARIDDLVKAHPEAADYTPGDIL